MDKKRDLKQLIADAEEMARQQKLAALRPPPAKVEEKTAAAADSAPVDPADTKVARALAKVGREIATQLKHAEDASAPGASMTAAAGQSPEQSTLTSPGKTPDLTASGGPMASKDTTERPGAPSLTPTTVQPEQTMLLGKDAQLKAAAAAVHQRYEDAARRINKTAEQPMGGVTTETKPLAGDKPEDRPDAPSSKGSPTPPATPEAVAGFSNLDADKQHTQDMPSQVGSPTAGASRPDAAMAHVESGESKVIKAAAMRALYSVLDPNSKLAESIRNRLVEMTKQADPPIPATDLAGMMAPLQNVPAPTAPVAPTLTPRDAAMLVGQVPTPDVRQTTDVAPAPGVR